MKQLLTKAFGYAAKPLGYTAQALGGFGAATGGLGLYFGSWTHVGASGDITSLGVAFTAASAGLYYLGKKLAASGKSTTPNNDTPPITLPIPAPKSGRKSAQSGFKKIMGRRRKGNIVNGWINLDKPSDMTSTDAVNIVRRALNAQKAGHGGTLDPLATGILPIALGEATKTIPYCQDHMKRYSFRVIWGEARDTDDAEGDVIETSAIRPSEAAILAALPAFTGDIEQIPPQFSAIKIDGERAYDRAREGKENKLAPRPVYIEELTLTDANADSAGFSCLCGKGTYMRSLARDLSKALGTVGYIADLRREAVGPLTTDNAISLAKLREIGDIARSEAEPDALEDVLLPVETVLDDIPALALNEKEAARLRNGQKLLFIARPDMDRLGQIGLEIGEDATALAIYNGKPIALVAVAGAEISPVRVLNL